MFASKRCLCTSSRPMGRAPCCNGEHAGLNKGPWTHEEDQKLKSFLLNNPQTSWRQIPQNAGLLRCGKSCRLRWMNYLRPDIRRGNFTAEEENLIIQLHASLGNKWSVIASQLPGRTDNEIKNLWNTRLRKMLILRGINPINHQPMCNPLLSDHIKNFIKSIESAIIMGLMTQSTSPSATAATTDDANISSTLLPPLASLPLLHPSSTDEVLTQFCKINSSSDHSTSSISSTLLPPLASLPLLHPSSPDEVLTQLCEINSSSDHSTSNNNSWARGSSRNDENSYDNSIWNESHSLSNNLSKCLGNEFENNSSPFLVGGMDLVASTEPFRAGEDGFQY